MTDTKKPSRAERQYSRAVFERQIPLNSVNVQKVHRRSAEYATNGLFNLEAVLPVVGNDKEAIVTLLSQVESLLHGVIEEFSTTKAQYNALMESNSIDNTIQYTHPNTTTFKLYSPMAGQLVSAFALADELITLVDTLWMAGILDPIQRKDATYAVQQRLTRLCGRVGGLGESASRSARKAGADVELKEQNSSDLDSEGKAEAISAGADVTEAA